MNTKYALALILTLQVSMSLCETPTSEPAPTPSPEVVAKCNDMRAKFNNRLLVAFTSMSAVATPLLEKSPILQFVRNRTSDTPFTTYLTAASSIASGVLVEANPLLDGAVAALQKLCVMSLSSDVGPYLDEHIKDAQFFLDIFMPAA